MDGTLETRVERLERIVESLQQLPGRIAVLETQLQRFKNEIRGEFLALRAIVAGGTRALGAEIRAGDEDTRQTLGAEIRAGDEDTRQILRDEIRAGDEETRRILGTEIRAGDEDTRRILGAEIQAGDKETQRQMRLLHEEVIARISLIQGG